MPLDIFKETIRNTLKPKCYKHFNCGGKYGCSLLTRIRVGRSFLKSHSYSINLADDPACECGHKLERPLHFFTQCTLYSEQRLILHSEIEQFIPKIKRVPHKRQLEIFLYGYEIDNDELSKINKRILTATQHFILNTKRFKE
jgi:hypothetical protein